MTNLLTIKDFSKFSGIPCSTLRYYDSEGIFCPIKRSGSGYRYYSPQQLTTFKFIKVLSNLNVPLEKIKQMKANRSPETILELLSKQEEYLISELRRLNEINSVIHTFTSLINRGIKANVEEIAVVRQEEIPIILGEPNDFKGEKYFYGAFMKFCSDTMSKNHNLNYPIGGLFETTEKYFANPNLPTRFFSLDPFGADIIPKGNYLTGYTKGYYGESGNLAKRMKKFAADNSIVLSGSAYQIFLHDEICIAEPKHYLSVNLMKTE
jgi:DNA-binding transcriptional MerR regulator